MPAAAACVSLASASSTDRERERDNRKPRHCRKPKAQDRRRFGRACRARNTIAAASATPVPTASGLFADVCGSARERGTKALMRRMLGDCG